MYRKINQLKKSKMVVLATCLLVMIVGAVSGCGQKTEPAVGAGTSEKVIVTSFYPMYVATLNVAKDVPGITVINMTKPQTGCLHDYQLTPEDIKTLEKASVFVANGAGMESFLEKVLKQYPKLTIVDASKDIPLLKNDNGEENPHVWVNIGLEIQQVKNIAAQLAAADPAHGEQYKVNGEKYAKKLEELRGKMHQELDSLSHREIITFHEAFPYFAQEFRLTIVSVIEREPGAEPTPKELEDTIAKVKQQKINALFVEPQYPARSAEVISRETGAKVYVLDPVVTGEATPGSIDDYLKVMEKNLQVLKEALK